MFTKIIRTFFSFGAPTNFENARLKCTYAGDYEPPSDSQINVILRTLGGKDQETRSEIGFLTFVSKLENSDSLRKWNYIIKNLIILDRCLEEKYFLNDISVLNLPHILAYKDETPLNGQMLIDVFVQKYFNYILIKANKYLNKSGCFNVEKNDLPHYFRNMSNSQILLELDIIIFLEDSIFEVISTNKKGLLKYKVNQHVFLLLLSTLMTLYSIEYIAIILLLDKIFTMSLESAKKCKEIYSKFIRFNEELIKFINNHQFIKGFQISTKNFYKSDPRVITSIDEYINIQSNPECEDNYEIIDLKEITDDIPLVIIKPQTEIRRRTIFSEPIIDKHNIKSPNENIKKDEFFHNIFKSEYYDETQYIDKVLKPVKESSQITKKQLANAVGSDKRKKYQNPNGLKLKILMKNNVDIIKQPILCLGAPSTNQKYAITPKKNRLSILDFPMVTLSYDSNNNLKKPKTDINSVKTRERKKSMLTIKRKTNNEKNVDIDFQPDFEEAIFETFPNCYSENFKAEKIWSFKDDGNYLNTFSRSSMRNY